MKMESLRMNLTIYGKDGNFYGFDVWSDHVSVTRQQLKNAVTNPADMGRLMDLILGTKSNEMENGRETFERATLANLIGALNAMGNTNQVRHLLTEYNAATGQSLTNVTVYAPDNYGSFIKWAYAQIAQASDMLTEYTSEFHLMRHFKTHTGMTPTEYRKKAR